MEFVRAAAADDGQVGGLRELRAIGGGVHAKLGDALHRREQFLGRAAVTWRLGGNAVDREGRGRRQLPGEGEVSRAVFFHTGSQRGGHDGAGVVRGAKIERERVDLRAGKRAGLCGLFADDGLGAGDFDLLAAGLHLEFHVGACGFPRQQDDALVLYGGESRRCDCNGVGPRLHVHETVVALGVRTDCTCGRGAFILRLHLGVLYHGSAGVVHGSDDGSIRRLCEGLRVAQQQRRYDQRTESKKVRKCIDASLHVFSYELCRDCGL